MKFLRVFGCAAVIGTVSALSLAPVLAQETPDATTGSAPETAAATPESAETTPEAVTVPDCSNILIAIDAANAEDLDRETQSCIAQLGAPGLTQEQIDNLILSLVEDMTSREVPAGMRPPVAGSVRALAALTSPTVSSGLTQIASTYETGDDVEVAATDQAASEQ